MNNIIRRILLLFLYVLFVSCSAYSKKVNLSIDVPYPKNDSWKSISMNASDSFHIANNWWEIFSDTKLDSIMEVFLRNNYDLKIAISSLEASKALSKINGSGIFPNLDVSLLNAAAFGPGSSIPDESYGLQLSSSWEIDLWGKLLSGRLSSLKEYESAVNHYDFIKFSIIAQGVKMYFNLVESKEQEMLSKSSVDALQDIFNIVEDRYNQGVRSSLDYRLSLSNLLAEKANLEKRRMIVDNLKREMEIMMGLYPSGTLVPREYLSANLPEIPSHLPSQVVENRPDIQSAYNKLESAKFSLKSANKAKFPIINLTDYTGAVSKSLEDLLKGNYLFSQVGEVGARITLPILQPGKIKANEELSKSKYNQIESEYEYTILKAFSEIENKLSTSKMLDNQFNALDAAYIQSAEAYNLAKDRYENGLSDLITVLDSQKRMFDTKGQMIAVRKMLIENRIDLLICLGGRLSES